MSSLGQLYNNDRDESTEESDHYNDDLNHPNNNNQNEDDYHEGEVVEEQNNYVDEEEEPDSDYSRVKNDGYGDDTENTDEYNQPQDNNDDYEQHQYHGDYNEYSQNNEDHGDNDEDAYYHDEEGHGEDDYHYVDEDEHHGDDLEKPRDFQDPSSAAGDGTMSRNQKVLATMACFICFLMALVLGTGIGAIMANNDTSFCEWFGWCDGDDKDGGSGGDNCPPPPVFIPESTFTCPEDNVQLEFRLTFDGSPADLGFRVADLFNVSLWNFPPRTFGTIALMNRENVFSVCLSPQANYTFTLTDVQANGLISNRFGSTQYGAFTLFYSGNVVATYHGDCESTTLPDECGAFSACTYFLAANTTSGSCDTGGGDGGNSTGV
jgi:hypothetical protein